MVAVKYTFYVSLILEYNIENYTLEVISKNMLLNLFIIA